MISIVKDMKQMKEPVDNRHQCTIQSADGECECSYERCTKSGDLRLLLEEGFGDEVKLPKGLVTIKLGDGSGAEYHGTFNDEGAFTPTR